VPTFVLDVADSGYLTTNLLTLRMLSPGLTKTLVQTGVAGDGDCSTAAGCTVTESNPNSLEDGFVSMGGGVWACQFDVAGIL